MGSLNLPTSGTVYLDTVALIYAVESVRPYSDLLAPLWQCSQEGGCELVTSELAVLETLVGPMKSGDSDLLAAYEEVLGGSDLKLIPIDDVVLRAAAQLRARTSIRTPDAIHAATALAHDVDSFITNDLGFRAIDSLPVQILKDML